MPNVGTSQALLLGSLDSTGNVLTGVTTGTSRILPVAGYGMLALYFRSIGVTSGGTVVVEEADWMPNEDPYAGTWSSVTSIAANTFTGGAQSAYHLTVGAFGYLRVRISATITGGGTIAVTWRAQGAS